MYFCKGSCVAIIIAFVTINPHNSRVLCNKTSPSVGGGGVDVGVWTQAGKMTGLLLHDCLRSREYSLAILRDCLKRKVLLACDRALRRDVIELASGVALVRYQQENDTHHNRELKYPKAAGMDKDEEDWSSQVVDKLGQLSRTHVLKIHLRGLEGSTSEGRGRHRKHNMFTNLIMFGMVAAGLIVIPLGFQFLAILGGKALLLAKMALLMSSIQGLKKIATSNLNYGLYSTSYGQGGPWHYDRQWPHDFEGQGDSSYDNFGGYHHSDLLHPRLD